MTVEITPSGPANVLAQQLLAVAEADDRFRIDDVKTTTFGPMGLAFLVPEELHAAWEAAYMVVEAVEAVAEAVTEVEAEVEAPKRRGRPRKTDNSEE